MRAATVGLVTIPVLVAGSLGIAAAVGVIGVPSADSAKTADTTTVASPSPSMAGPGPGGGTAIDGTKPHLTVVDGRAAFMLPGALPAILSALPYRPVELEPLPSATDSLSSPANRTADQASTPSTRAFEAPSLQHPTMPPATGGYVWPLPPTQAAGGATPAPSQVSSPQIDPLSTPGSPSGAQPPLEVDPVRNAPDVVDPDNSAPGRPPHASDHGRPPHADQTGRPDHAHKTGRPPHASDHGPGNSRNGNGKGNGKGADNIRSSPR